MPPMPMRLPAQSLLPDLQRASDRFGRLAANERESGALTGSSGSGSVVQLLTQMSAQMTELSQTIRSSQDRVQELFDQGSQRIAKMRELVSGPGSVQPRADEFASEAVQLTGIIAALQETSVAPSVKRAAADLSLGFIAPVADGASQDLVNRQDQVMETVRQSVAAQSQALTQAADEILAEPRVATRRFVALSSAEAVLRYFRDFIPSWAGAISIDLLPFVMVLVLMVVHDAMRREADVLEDADTMTAADMMRAVALYNQMAAEAREEPPAPNPDPDDEEPLPEQEPDAPDAKPDATVTPIIAGHRKRPE